MNQKDLKFVMGVLAHYIMDTPSVSSKRRAIEIMNRLKEEFNHG